MARRRIPEKFQHWIDARKRHRLSHAQVQMARELGMNPTRLGKIDNDDQEPWKVPLPRFIEALYDKRSGKTRPEVVLSMEGLARFGGTEKGCPPQGEGAQARGKLVSRSRLEPSPALSAWSGTGLQAQSIVGAEDPDLAD